MRRVARSVLRGVVQVIPLFRDPVRLSSDDEGVPDGIPHHRKYYSTRLWSDGSGVAGRCEHNGYLLPKVGIIGCYGPVYPRHRPTEQSPHDSFQTPC